MLIVISGGSTTAEFLISSMLHKGHRIVVIEEDREQIEHLSEALPPQVLIVEGDGCDSTVQLDAGVDDADLFVALMGHDDTNLVACEIAMTNFRVPRCIATVNSPKTERIFKEVGIEPVSSTKIIGRMIDEEALTGAETAVLAMPEGDLVTMRVRLPRKMNNRSGVFVKDIPYSKNMKIVGVARDGQIIMVHNSLTLQPGDTVIAAVKSGSEDEFRQLAASL